MNTMYRFNIKITGHAPVARAAIEDALNRVWPLDFDCDENGEIEGVGDDVLCGSMDEHAMVDDFAAAVWRANGGPCEIDVTATCLEDLPHERYSRDDEDYYDWRAKRELRKELESKYGRVRTTEEATADFDFVEHA